VTSRLDVDLSTGDGTGASIPVVAANMTAVSGRRMAETIARCGGLAVIPQDIPVEVVTEVVAWIKKRHTIYDTPLVMTPTGTVGEALNLLPKRGHGAVIVVDNGRAVGVVTDADCEGVDRFTQLEGIMSRELLTLPAGIAAEDAFNQLHDGRHRLAPVVDRDGSIVGILTRQRALRATLYEPAVDAAGKLRVAAAIGINGDAEQKAKALLDAGIDVLVIDTAHGHQERMIDVLRIVRALDPQVPTSSRPAPTSSRSAWDRERCARPGCRRPSAGRSSPRCWNVRPGPTSSASTSGPTGESGIRATSRSHSRPARPA
jgi:IMP dehydrogenase